MITQLVKLMSVCIVLSVFSSIGGEALAQAGEGDKGLPEVTGGRYKVDPYIHLAIKLQAQGKEKACDTLKALAKDISLNKQVIVLCRMLFTSKPNQEFRRPRLGAPGYLGDTENSDWPLSPIEIVDGVPFLISPGYSGSGLPELAENYLTYCIQNCDWVKAPFGPRTAHQKQQALKKLMASPKWKRPLGDREEAFLASQIK